MGSLGHLAGWVTSRTLSPASTAHVFELYRTATTAPLSTLEARSLAINS